jgi:hypothetical protein
MDGAVTDGLSGAIVNIARLMRHDGIRLVVGTQSPRALAPELLELVTVAVIHRFHSKDWFSYLKVKIPLENAAWDRLLDLNPGEALVFASRHQIGEFDKGEDGGTAEGEGEGDDESDTASLYSDNIARTARHALKPFPLGRNIFKIKIRARITAEVGSSAVNKPKIIIPHHRM